MTTQDVALVVVGVTLLCVVTFDILVTAVTPDRGAGPLTTRLGRALSRAVSSRSTQDLRRVVALGPLALMGTLGVWAVLFTCGWWALFGTVPVDVPREVGATPLDVLAHTVTSISSLGSGYVQPTSELGRLMTAAAGLSGLGLLTLAVTFVLPVVTAVSRRRVLARRISALGATTTELVEVLGRSNAADRVLEDVAASLRGVAQDHLSYPVLHHFRTSSREVALAPNIAALDEAVTVLCSGSDDGAGLDDLSVRALRAAVSDLLTVTEHYLAGHTADTAPPWPEQLAPGDEDALDRDDHEHRRRRLAAYVREDGWDWDRDVHSPSDDARERTPEPAEA